MSFNSNESTILGGFLAKQQSSKVEGDGRPASRRDPPLDEADSCHHIQQRSSLSNSVAAKSLGSSQDHQSALERDRFEVENESAIDSFVRDWAECQQESLNARKV